MALLSVSQHDVELHVTAYFARRFGVDPSQLPPGTNVRKAFHFQPAAWEGLADVFNKMQWVIQLGVLLLHSDFTPLKSIEDIAKKILSKVARVVHVPDAAFAPNVLATSSLVRLPRAKLPKKRSMTSKARKPRRVRRR